MPESNNTLNPATLLRGGALAFLLIGIAIAIWLVDKAIRHPEIQASQFGYSAPLWTPALLFVAVSTAAGTYMLLRAARRVDAGENLFAGRHRRRPEANRKEKRDAGS